MLMYCFYNVVPSKEESENTESSAPDQDDDEPEGAIAGDTTDLFSAVSSTPFAFPKGPSGNFTYTKTCLVAAQFT